VMRVLSCLTCVFLCVVSDLYKGQETFVPLPSGRHVRLTVHLNRMIALVDLDYRPLGAEDVLIEDWEYLFFHYLPSCGSVLAHA